jgi:hypothetical protein
VVEPAVDLTVTSAPGAAVRVPAFRHPAFRHPAFRRPGTRRPGTRLACDVNTGDRPALAVCGYGGVNFKKCRIILLKDR